MYTIKKMNPEAKALWVAALRSGKYQQGFGRLEKVVDGKTYHCCLGVLCRVAMEAGVETTAVAASTPPSGVVQTLFDDCNTHVPPIVNEWSGLDYWNTHGVMIGGYAYNFVALNDEQLIPFSKIADLIEEQL